VYIGKQGGLQKSGTSNAFQKPFESWGMPTRASSKITASARFSENVWSFWHRFGCVEKRVSRTVVFRRVSRLTTLWDNELRIADRHTCMRDSGRPTPNAAQLKIQSASVVQKLSLIGLEPATHDRVDTDALTGI